MARGHTRPEEDTNTNHRVAVEKEKDCTKKITDCATG
jgi:hypothetical protein